MMRIGPRELKPEERGLLQLLLSKDFIGSSELAAQVEETKVAGGLPTFLDLDVSRGATVAVREDGPIPVRAVVRTPEGELEGELLVWVEKGYLSGLEFAWYTNEAPNEIPGPDRIAIE